MSNKIIWITGGSSGIGFATAIEFKELGAEVIVLDNDKKGIERVRSKYDINEVEHIPVSFLRKLRGKNAT